MASKTSLLVAHELEDARHAWRRGEWARARAAAQRALNAAVECRDRHSEAGASLLLAQVLSLESSFARACRFASRARLLYTEEGDAEGIAEAVLALSAIETALGHTEQAAAAAEMAIAGADGAACRTAAGLNCLGVAALWAGDHARARSILDESRRLAAQAPSVHGSGFQPLANILLSEVLNSMEQRARGQAPDLTELDALVTEAGRMVRADVAVPLHGDFAGPGLLLLEFASCFLTSRFGRLADANEHYIGCLQQAARLPPTHWMHALVWWARLERTLAAGDTGGAAVSVASMVVAAEAGEHVPMKALAQVLGARANRYLDRAAAMPPCYLPARGSFAADAAAASAPQPLPDCTASTRRECKACVRNLGRATRPGEPALRA